MKYLRVNACFLKHRLGQPAVVRWFALYQVCNIVNATILQAKLLLFVATIQDTSCKIVRCLALHNKVQYKLQTLILLSRCSSAFLFSPTPFAFRSWCLCMYLRKWVAAFALVLLDRLFFLRLAVLLSWDA